MINLTQNEVKTCWQLIRQGLYLALVILVALSLRVIASYFHEGTFREFGIVENMQLTLLGTSAIVFIFESFILKAHRALLLFLASLCLFAFCRELDSYFDIIIPVVSWKFSFLFPILALINLYRAGDAAKRSLFRFFSSPAFWLMFMAFSIGIALAQCLGHRPMIAAVVGGNSNAGLIRRILEEGAELIGYLWILLSSIEFYFNFKPQK